MTSPHSRIAIIGAGVSGLTTAICLRRLGFNRVHIYDSKSSNNINGSNTPTGYIIAANGVRILDRLGIAEQLVTSGVNIATVHHTKLTGQRLTSYAPSSVVGQNLRHSSKRTALSNVACWSHILLNILHDCLPADSITYNHKLTNIHKAHKLNTKTQESKVILRCEFNNEHTAELADFNEVNENNVKEYQHYQTNYEKHDYDIVIGCDGINSYVRKHELEHGRNIGFRDIEGSVYVSGVSELQDIDEYWKRNRSHCVEMWGNGVRLIHTYISQSHIYWHLSLNSKYAFIAENKQTAINNIIRHLNSQFTTSIRQLIDCTDSNTVQSGLLRDRVPSSRFASDEYNIAVVGSAQHMLTIDTYQSVAQCLESAMALSCALAENDINNAFSTYSQIRYARLNYITNQAHSETTQAIAYNGFMAVVRDWAVGLMPANASDGVLKSILQYDINTKFSTRVFDR